MSAWYNEIDASVNSSRGPLAGSSCDPEAHGTWDTIPMSSLAISSSRPSFALRGVHSLGCGPRQPLVTHRMIGRPWAQSGSAGRTERLSYREGASLWFGSGISAPCVGVVYGILGRPLRWPRGGILESIATCSPAQEVSQCVFRNVGRHGHLQVFRTDAVFDISPCTAQNSISPGYGWPSASRCIGCTSCHLLYHV